MIKTTLQEIKKNSSIEGREAFKKYLKDNNVKPLKVELIAFSQSVYGLGSYLAAFTLSNNTTIKVATGNRTSWNYCIENNDFGL